MKILLLIICLILPALCFANSPGEAATSVHFLIDAIIIVLICVPMYFIISRHERRRYMHLLQSKDNAELAPSQMPTSKPEEKPEEEEGVKVIDPVLISDPAPVIDPPLIESQQTSDDEEKTLIESEPEAEAETETVKITPLDEKTLEKAMTYVVSNMKRADLSVEELSSYLGMSRVHLYKKLKVTTGKTPVEFIRQIRLEHGAKLLRESRMTVAEVAFQIGYNNPKYFSKYFREEFGMLPSAYQTTHKKSLN